MGEARCKGKLAMLLKKVVLAEDDDAIAHMVSMTLGDAGFLCLRARDGDEALNLVKREDPDCLVLDIMMPHTDGIEVARRLKSDVLASRVPILMTTALGSVKDKVKGLDAGADDYLAKPFDLRELAARVRALVRASKRERDRNPTTNLPGAMAVDTQVDDLLGEGTPFAFLYVDVSDFDSVVEAVGFKGADDIIVSMGKLVMARARQDMGVGGQAAFVGHVGGDDFVVIADPSKAEALAEGLVEDFEAQRASWTNADAANAPTLKLSIAIVDTSKTPLSSSEELGRAVARTKRESREREGSNHVFWSGS